VAAAGAMMVCAFVPPPALADDPGGAPVTHHFKTCRKPHLTGAKAAYAAYGAGIAIAHVASDLIGCPYHFGGNATKEGFDCSGLVWYVHQLLFRLPIPRTAEDQSNAARLVPVTRLMPGDLLFFRFGEHNVDHVGIYAGTYDGVRHFIHAPKTGEPVMEAALDDEYYQQHLVAAGRFWTAMLTPER
jgi:cell wall-associated NlpC family hydrolase